MTAPVLLGGVGHLAVVRWKRDGQGQGPSSVVGSVDAMIPDLSDPGQVLCGRQQVVCDEVATAAGLWPPDAGRWEEEK
jgi:hypothetical protein